MKSKTIKINIEFNEKKDGYNIYRNGGITRDI